MKKKPTIPVCKVCKKKLQWCNSVIGRILWCVNASCPNGPGKFEGILKQAKDKS